MKKLSQSEIESKLQQAEKLFRQGKSLPDICKALDVSRQTFYRWLNKCGDMTPEMVKQLRTFLKENTRLRKSIGDFDNT
jgi:putative transposase